MADRKPSSYFIPGDTPEKFNKSSRRIPPVDRCFYCQDEVLYEEGIKGPEGLYHPECKDARALSLKND